MSFVPAHVDIRAADARPSRVGVILHGILGSSKNWLSFARRVVRDRPGWRLLLVDQRHHGDSGSPPPPDTLEACAEDVARLCEGLGVAPELVVGHSFGGKVALAYARRGPAGLRQVWSLDAPPAAGEADGVRDVFAGLRLLVMPAPGRESVARSIVEAGFGQTIAAWMTTNLRPAAEGGVTWRFDLDGAQALLADYTRQDLWPVVEDPPPGVRVVLVRAGRGGHWSGEEIARAERAAGNGPGAAHVLHEAGHWVHIDDPAGLARLLDEAML